MTAVACREPLPLRHPVSDKLVHVLLWQCIIAWWSVPLPI